MMLARHRGMSAKALLVERGCNDRMAGKPHKSVDYLLRAISHPCGRREVKFRRNLALIGYLSTRPRVPSRRTDRPPMGESAMRQSLRRSADPAPRGDEDRQRSVTCAFPRRGARSPIICRTDVALSCSVNKRISAGYGRQRRLKFTFHRQRCHADVADVPAAARAG